MSFFSLSPVLLWFLIGIATLSLELLTPGFIGFFFGIGAWCTALAVYLYPFSPAGQLLIFLITSISTLLLLRSTLKKIFLGRSREIDAMENGLPSNATGEVVEDIVPPASGTVKYAGSFWQATAEVTLTRGTVVRITGKNNLTVQVAPMAAKGDI
ncbi:NfeD family protein [Desulfobulbus oligotrophicus]|jgi:membrane protein implicated in regulation of membrane protease activity|uniref:NfeD family protein n=1 Tax=Desulfobulbus oligotrophicus TaxID=1909699 RepID=A0A7T5VCB5_9BACT|nr:NfeD family protein [Desulfobulbus oligotrophicus]MDY0390081.1 NfeD family protein [Desulfobulbus oligotrophicus]QQG65191.1 NfeD family protein [Desulfobulbus oligotrophicus]